LISIYFKDNVTAETEEESTEQQIEIPKKLDEEEETINVDDMPDKVPSDISLSSSESEGSSSDTDSENDQQFSQRTVLVSSQSTSEMDVVCIDLNETTSDDGRMNDEEDATQSWGQRWLSSKKVKKVIANAKLGNKIRGKIKDKKIEEKKVAEENERLKKL